MSFRNLDNKAAYTVDGIPYLWNSGDVTTLPSNENFLIADSISSVYGSAVAVGCGRIIVSSPISNGSVYIYDLNGNYINRIYATIGQDGFDLFGDSISINNGIIVVGCPNDEGIGGGSNRGSVHVYDLNGNFINYMEPNIPTNNSFFGKSVSVNNGRIVVGAPGISSFYIFDLNGNELQKITEPTAASFGQKVAVGCGKIVVASPSEAEGFGLSYVYDLYGNFIKYLSYGRCVGINSGRIVTSTIGNVNVHDLNGDIIKQITSPDGAFGDSISIGSGRIVIGAYTSSYNGSNSGCCYIFDLDGNELLKLFPGTAGDIYGYSVSVGSGKIIIGAPGDDNANGSDAGAVYIYDTPQVYNLYDALDLNIRLA